MLFGASLALARPAAAAWPTDPLTNVSLCSASGNQYSPMIIPDNAGGAIVAWHDHRGADYDIYAQHVLSSGALDPAWPTDGRAVCSAAGDQQNPRLVSDGAGGAIVTWHDLRNGVDLDIYAQHVRATGTVDPAWPAGGRALCAATGNQQFPTIVPDGSGGAIVAWYDHRGASFDIYAQRVLSGGAVDPAWPSDGRALCSAANDQFSPMVTDGAGGAVLAWYDYRSGTNYDVYAQHVLVSGAADPSWPGDGRAVCSDPANQYSPALVTDGSGGAVVAWHDGRNGSDYDVYAQHVLASGGLDPAWPVQGRAVCSQAGDQQHAALIGDGAGGAIVAWEDLRSGTDADVYAEHVLATGALDAGWPAGGRALCVASGEQGRPVLVADKLGGAIVAWYDIRNEADYDIYAQRVLASGAVDPAWPSQGRAVSTASGSQTAPSIAPDGVGGAIIAWHDFRNGANYDIYAQRVQQNGQLGGGAVSVPDAATFATRLDLIRPNPLRGTSLEVRFTLGSSTGASLELLDVTGRRVLGRDVGSLGAGAHAVDLAEGHRMAPGIYLVRLRHGGHDLVRRVAVLD